MTEAELIDFEPFEEDAQQKEDKKGPSAYSGVQISGFRDFLLKAELNRAIENCGFEHPSEVQHQCIPQAIVRSDIICQAKSGMGKTAVFVIAVLQQLEESDESAVKCLVLCHTRELAYQVAGEFNRFAKFMPYAKTRCFYGGVPIEQDKAALKNGKDFPNIIVGTPGRILALVQSKDLKLDKLKFFILDECDKCLEALDMRQDVQNIYLATPRVKQVMMFSATMPKEVRETAKKFMQNPVEIYVDAEAKLTLHGLQQYFVKVLENGKNRKLIDLLDALEFNQVVIFVKSVPRAKALTEILKQCNFPATCIHSQMPQAERITQYTQFKSFKSRIMVSTDLFGRGIDIEKVNIVINYDMSDSADTYLHRVGRAGRFGTKGLALTFIAEDTDEKCLQEVQNRFEVTVKELPEYIDKSTYMQS